MVHGASRRVRRAAAGNVRLRVWVSASVAALGGLLFGYDAGVVSGALPYIRNDFGGLSSLQQELVTSLLLVGAAAGALVAGKVADRIGRTGTIMSAAGINLAGTLLAAFSVSYVMLLAGRVILGLSTGLFSAVVPMYIAEIAPSRMRGGLVGLYQLAITSGILAAFLVDYALSGSHDWRLMLGMALVPSAALLTGMLVQPDTPQWLIGKGREDEARAAMSRLLEPGEIEAEMAGLRAAAAHPPAGMRAALAPAVRPLLVMGVLLAVFQQVTGINAVIYYAPSLLTGAGFGHEATLLANVVRGALSVALTMVAIRLLDRVGRRPLLLSGTVAMAAGLAITALSFLGGSRLTGALALVAVAGLVVFTGAFAIGLGPVFWLLIAEIYPLGIRGGAMSVATLANWAANFLVTVSFLTLLDGIGADGAFWLFGAITVIAMAYIWRNVPETKGRSPEDIGRGIMGGNPAPAPDPPRMPGGSFPSPGHMSNADGTTSDKAR